jgi:hypothetical protein
MTRPATLGEVIAGRLQRRMPGRDARAVTLRIGRSVPMAAGDALADDCGRAVDVAVDYAPRHLPVVGSVDALQALALALDHADLPLQLIERVHGGTLTSLDGELDAGRSGVAGGGADDGSSGARVP